MQVFLNLTAITKALGDQNNQRQRENRAKRRKTKVACRNFRIKIVQQ